MAARPLTRECRHFSGGVFTPATFGVGDFVPGIGTSPRPYRVSTAVAVPTLLQPIINSTNPYADGAYPSGHTNSGYLQALATAFLVPQRGQQLLTRASELGNKPGPVRHALAFDVIGGRIESSAIAPPTSTARSTTRAATGSTGRTRRTRRPTGSTRLPADAVLPGLRLRRVERHRPASNAGLPAAATPSAAAQNKADYTARLTFGFQPSGTVTPMTTADVPLQAQVLLLTRFPYLTDAQRTEVLAGTACLRHPVLGGNTYDGWAGSNSTPPSTATAPSPASHGDDGRRAGRVLPPSTPGATYIAGSGALTKAGTGTLVLTGTNTYAGGTTISGARWSAMPRPSGRARSATRSLVLDQANDAGMANALPLRDRQPDQAQRRHLEPHRPEQLTGATAILGGRLAVKRVARRLGRHRRTGAGLGRPGVVGGVVSQSGSTIAPRQLHRHPVGRRQRHLRGRLHPQVEANAAGQADRLSAIGTATLQGGTVQVLAQNGAYDRAPVHHPLGNNASRAPSGVSPPTSPSSLRRCAIRRRRST